MEKNIDINPNELASQSKKKCWWKCDKNQKHSWDATVQSISKGATCPYCLGRRVLTEESFKAKCPDGVEFWDYEKNKDYKPDQFSPQSNKSAWWKCRIHGSWKAKIQSIYLGSRCKKCTSNQSILEKTIISELSGKVLNIKVVPLYKLLNDECDIYLPDYGIIIEVDGYHWHKNKLDQDQEKSERIIKEGFSLIRLREKRLPKISNKKIIEILYDEKEPDFDVCKRLVGILQDVINVKQKG